MILLNSQAEKLRNLAQRNLDEGYLERGESKMAIDKRKVIIGTPESPARSSFMFCRVLKEPEDDTKGTARGTCAILFSKKDKKTHAKVLAAIEEAGKKKFGVKFNASSRKYSNPIRDGDELADDEEYSVGDEARGMWFISTSCYKVPQIVDESAQRIIDPEEIEEKMASGNYFCFSVTFKGFDNESKGVRGELNNLMFIKKGDRLDGSASAEDDFQEYAMDSNNDDDDADEEEEDSPRRSRKSSSRRSKKRR
jgi:hypothetical protein